jgi:hypothetical protein
MNNLMSNFSGLALTRMEMKKVTGGWVTYACSCTGRVGSWTGTYRIAQGAANAIDRYCGGNGACRLQPRRMDALPPGDGDIEEGDFGNA